MIEVCNLSAGYGKTEVLHNISLSASCGEITTVIGNNGCGKSTLLKSIVGLLPIQSGKIIIDGADTDNISSGERARLLAYLPQVKGVPDICAGRMVLHGRFPYLSYPRRYSRTDLDIASSAMEQMGISSLADRQMSELSGGTRQKVYIAMALAQRAPVVMLDEPTVYLDIGQRKKLAETLRSLADSGKTILLVLHDILLALKISDKIAVIDNGGIAMCESPGEILESGLINRIFGINIKSVSDNGSIQYYYEL